MSANDRNNIKAGDVMFVWGTSLLEKEISRVTKNGASHCALCVDWNTVYEAQGGREIGENTIDFYFNDPDIERIEIWRDNTLTDDERIGMVEHGRDLFGLPYDYLAIPLELAHFDLHARISWYHENKHFICSTYVNDCAKSQGKTWTDQTLPAPCSLYRGKKLSRVLILKGNPQPDSWIEDTGDI